MTFKVLTISLDESLVWPQKSLKPVDDLIEQIVGEVQEMDRLVRTRLIIS
jgi:hypothetical protein